MPDDLADAEEVINIRYMFGSERDKYLLERDLCALKSYQARWNLLFRKKKQLIGEIPNFLSRVCPLTDRVDPNSKITDVIEMLEYQLAVLGE